MDNNKALVIYIGTAEESARRKSALRAIAEDFGLTTQRGQDGTPIGNISALIQGIADGDYTLSPWKDNTDILDT